MDIRLNLRSIDGGAIIPVSGTRDTAGAVVIDKVIGDSRVSQAHLPVINPQGGPQTNIRITIHDDGTLELGTAVTPFVSEGYLLLETPSRDNPLQVAVAIAANGTPTLSNVTFTTSGAPTFNAAEVGNVDASTVVVRFSEKVTAADYAAGVTIKVDTVAATISSATRQANHTLVHFVLNTPVANGEAVTWEYAAAGGTYADETDGTLMANVSAQVVTNNVPAE